MTIMRTDLTNTRDSAKEIRVEVAGAITATNVQDALEQIATTPQAVDATNITFANSPYTPLVTDSVIYADTSGGAITINLALAAARNGVPLTIKDISGNAAANNITINRAGAETIEGLTSWPVAVDFGGVRLNPETGIGYVVAP